MTEWLRSFLPTSPAGWAWLLFGAAGQLIFGLRWLVQLVASERSRRSTVPVSFWWMSLVGGLMVAAYAVHKRDLVFALAQWGVVVYLRNIALLRRERREAGAA